jgi:phosphopantothenoylcysteine decarboxylase / phosphopantothenate---cysteine ligase
MSTPMQGKRILLGITGSIACYKAADLASKLTQAGALVDVILTRSAQQFVTPLTFQSVTGRRAFVDDDLWGSEGHVQHIALGHQADLLIIAPATANTIARLAHGLADNLLTVTALAASCPLLIAPAMDGHMYLHTATQENLARLIQRGATILGPAEGHLASGQTGTGRMVEPAELLGRIRLVLGRSGPLAGWRVLVTAGGTEEPIDPVRVITNRSSGKQGYALVQAALDLGARVQLVSGPTSLTVPIGAERIGVRTAVEMLEAISKNLPATDVLVMAAAVADFRPAQPSENKIKKQQGPPTILLETNPDILACVSQQRARTNTPEIVVGFAAESQDLLANAQAKLIAKTLDLIVANDILASDAGFSVDTNRATLLDDTGKVEELPLLSKMEVAQAVMERVVQMIQIRPVIHICQRQEWELARQKGVYAPASLEAEGFIHFSRPRQVLPVVNRFFAHLPDLVLLWIDPRMLNKPLRWELADGDLFPHLYNPLNLEAVTRVLDLRPDEDGQYRSLPQD